MGSEDGDFPRAVERPSDADSDRSFAVDGARVVHETVDGETILIDLETGTYYSLAGSGSEIWELLISGTSLECAADALSRRYPSDATEARLAVRQFADGLAQEQLLSPGPVQGAPVPDSAPATTAFAAPVLHRYTDMEYFLRLDPIHETDAELGWPQPASGNGAR